MSLRTSGHAELHAQHVAIGGKKRTSRWGRWLIIARIGGTCQTKRVGRVDQPPHGITRCRELIEVLVALIDRDPVVRDRLAVAYVEKIVALVVCRSPIIRWRMKRPRI